MDTSRNGSIPTRRQTKPRELQAGVAEYRGNAVNKFRRSKRSPSVLFISFCLFVACLSRIPVEAQDQGPAPIRVDVNLVVLDATVKTKAGQIMGNLKKEDFVVREDGAAKKIDLFSRDELPLKVALVLDLSDSIGPFLGPLRDAAATTLAALKPEDEVALFTFSTEAELSVPLTNDKAKLPRRSGVQGGRRHEHQRRHFRRGSVSPEVCAQGPPRDHSDQR